MERDGPIWIDEKIVSKITGRAIQTLRNDRFHRRGIPYYKIGRSVRYRLPSQPMNGYTTVHF